MAARRNKRSRRRNRGRFGFLYKLLSCVLILAAIITGSMVFFRVNTILVTGNVQYTQEEIIAATGVTVGDNLFQVNKFKIAPKVLTALPYTSEITISRKLPDTLVLEVTECVPVAFLREGEVYWLLDSKGKLLERADASRVKGLAQIHGLIPLAPSVGSKLAVGEKDSKKLESLTTLLNALATRGMGDKLNFVDVTSDREIYFGYEDRLTVVFPMICNFEEKVFAFSRTLEKMASVGDQGAIGTLYFTYEDGNAHLLLERWMPGDYVPEVSEDPEETPAAGASPSPSATPGEEVNEDE